MEVLRILKNNQIICDQSIQLESGDQIDMYCSLSSDSYIVEAYQEIMKTYQYRTAGMYHILESIAQTPTYSTVTHIKLSQCGLVDGDIYHFLLPLQIPLNSLTKLDLSDNQLTDMAGTLLALWILKGNCPQLREIRLGGNCWHDRGLSHLFFALKDQLRIDSIDVTRLRIDNEAMVMLTSLIKSFTPVILPESGSMQGLSLCFVFVLCLCIAAKYMAMSPIARKSFLSSFSDVALENLELDGVSIPDTIEFVSAEEVDEG